MFRETVLSKSAPILLIGNGTAIKLAKYPDFHKRRKHIAVRFIFVPARLQEGELRIEQVSSKNQIAGFFTRIPGRVSA